MRERRGLDVLVIVGAFPPDTLRPSIGGGILTDCDALLGAGIGDAFELRVIDSSKPMTVRPSLLADIAAAAGRMLLLMRLLLRRPRPKGALIFVSDAASFIEKGVMALLCKAFGLTVVLAPRGGAVREQAHRHPLLRALIVQAVRRSDRVLCQGESWTQWFSELAGGRSPKIVPMRNWTASDALLAIGKRRLAQDLSDAVADRPATILYLGALLRAKGVFDLLDGFAGARRQGGLLRLVVAGDGPDAPALRAHARTLGIESDVEFAGWVGGPHKLALLEAADIFCLPSHAEGLPNALIEAMACALPAIVTPVGAVREVAIDGQTALLVPVGEVKSLATSMLELGRAPEERRRMGEAAYLSARKDLSASRAVRQIAAFFTIAADPTGTGNEAGVADPPTSTPASRPAEDR